MFPIGRHVQILNFHNPTDDDTDEYLQVGYKVGDICEIMDYYDNEGDIWDNNVRLKNPTSSNLGDIFWFAESMLKLIPITAIRRP